MGEDPVQTVAAAKAAVASLDTPPTGSWDGAPRGQLSFHCCCRGAVRTLPPAGASLTARRGILHGPAGAVGTEGGEGGAVRGLRGRRPRSATAWRALLS